MTQRPSIDGFVPRRSVNDGASSLDPQRGNSGLVRSELAGLKREDVSRVGLVRPGTDSEAQPISLARADIDESLKSIDEPQVQDGRHGRRKKHDKKPKSRRRIIKWVILALLLIVVAVGGWMAYKALTNTGAVFKGGLLGLVQHEPLKQDANGRTNILILGTSEDDPGHPGGYLTDSLMVLTMSQDKKDAYMISIPRDLYVKYGRACNSGYAGRINEFFNCVNDDYDSEAAEDERMSEARKFFGEIVGLDVQYSVHVNYTVMRDIVAALDGVTVTIESRDPRGQMDSNFDWKCKAGDARASLATIKKNCPPNGHFIDYPNGPVTLDAEHALYLAQARGDIAPTYGFEQSNFDREKNQQKILVAIKEKALSGGTLADLGKVSGILDALGKNLRTNFETKEVQTLVDLAKNIDSSAIQSISLIDAEPPLVQTSNVSGMSVVIPSEGLYQYGALQAYIQKKVNSNPLTREEARVMVLNASGVSGAAQTEANKLTDLGMILEFVGNAPESSVAGKNVIYRVAAKPKTATETKLKQLYGVSQVTTATTIPGVTLGDETEYVIILGKLPESKTDQN
ncbi:MAG: LCP family protein [Candidatus Saccharimonas sp.]